MQRRKPGNTARREVSCVMRASWKHDGPNLLPKAFQACLRVSPFLPVLHGERHHTQPGPHLTTSLWLGLQAVHKQGNSSPWPSLGCFLYQPISTHLRLAHSASTEPPMNLPSLESLESQIIWQTSKDTLSGKGPGTRFSYRRKRLRSPWRMYSKTMSNGPPSVQTPKKRTMC